MSIKTETTTIVQLGDDRVLAFAARCATVAFNRLEGPIRQALDEAEDEAERDEIAEAIANTLGDAVADAVTVRMGLL